MTTSYVSTDAIAGLIVVGSSTHHSQASHRQVTVDNDTQITRTVTRVCLGLLMSPWSAHRGRQLSRPAVSTPARGVESSPDSEFRHSLLHFHLSHMAVHHIHHLHYHRLHLLHLAQYFILNSRLGSSANPFLHRPFPFLYRTDSTGSRSQVTIPF